jgi:hypothetical protein
MKDEGGRMKAKGRCPPPDRFFHDPPDYQLDQVLAQQYQTLDRLGVLHQRVPEF